jgi:hypothetical protein
MLLRKSSQFTPQHPVPLCSRPYSRPMAADSSSQTSRRVCTRMKAAVRKIDGRWCFVTVRGPRIFWDSWEQIWRIVWRYC